MENQNIYKKIIGGDSVFVIAEIGKNFIQSEDEKAREEYVKNAKELILAAKESGADAVKFQTHNLEDEFINFEITSPHFTGSDRYKWIKRNEDITPLEFWQELKNYADELGITFFSTPMSRGAAQKLEKINTPLWKVGSGDLLDFVLLDYIAFTKKPIILSSGMSTLKEIDGMIQFMQKRTADIALLHCVSKYPAEPRDLNLKTIKFFKERYNIPIGFSDHSIGHESAVAATSLGAKIIEKHFSFNRDLWGSDHKVSMTPDEFKKMVAEIKNKKEVKLFNFGRQAKILNREEMVFRPIFRKSLVAGRDIKAGEILSDDMVYAMRPQVQIGGIPSEEYETILGKKVLKDMKKYEPFKWTNVKGSKKRKICFVVTSKIHYSRCKLLLEELKKREDVHLQIVVGASALLEKYGNILSIMEEDGFRPDAKITMILEGGSPVAMAKTAGIGISEFATIFDNLRPDVVVVRGDRYEVLSAAIAAAYLNIAVAHIEGGDVSGTIDESVRHAITKISHIHFATNETSKQRIIRMGEDPNYVFDFGSLDLELVSKNDYSVSKEFVNYLGVGDVVNIDKPYIIVMQHPVTSEIEKNRANIEQTLKAVYELNVPTVWFWPNVDAGTDDISKGIRVFREKYKPQNIRFIIFLPPEEFIGLLKSASCLIGNSSSGIKECSYLGVPVVNIGTRQNNRMRGENIIDVDYDAKQIKEAINKQIKHGKYKENDLYYKKSTSNKIAEKLAEIELYIQKKFYE
jgi:UDP-hydrolysing UDP-N-acetyl-D-glucosamine 2-epimerase